MRVRSQWDSLGKRRQSAILRAIRAPFLEGAVCWCLFYARRRAKVKGAR
jgi:hypothetical protein